MNNCLFNCKLILTDDTIRHFFNVDITFVNSLLSMYETMLHTFTLEFSQFVDWGYYVDLFWFL